MSNWRRNIGYHIQPALDDVSKVTIRFYKRELKLWYWKFKDGAVIKVNKPVDKLLAWIDKVAM